MPKFWSSITIEFEAVDLAAANAYIDDMLDRPCAYAGATTLPALDEAQEFLTPEEEAAIHRRFDAGCSTDTA